MTVISILTRLDTLCKKYEKYDLEKQGGAQDSSNDAFLKLYKLMESDIEAALQKSSDASIEKNRAAVATLNAEVRRAKASMRNEISHLQKLAHKKVKGVTKEELAARPDIVLGLVGKIEAIPEGTIMGIKPKGGKPPAIPFEIKMDGVNPEDLIHPEQYQDTEESKGFREVVQKKKGKQDEGLEVISEGLETLKNMAQDINEELSRQVPLVEEIDSKVDKAALDLGNTNIRLKDTITKLRSSRNFCIDIVLMCVVLGIAGYLYK
ncbi:hypothetical protein O6H91_06G000400 [Diphasiastrum complanatum]|uniref:Uncharacterized protein n=1 Tax=Diphasiastrum complanatum TaxID=34168 RepID=A0ACC2DAH4_DIPCM|nr:hypothetical protein O6H91_06G000400 [Diphasiastrum complanatum]